MSAITKLPLYEYNLAAGMEPRVAARDARAKFVILQVVWFKLCMLLIVMSSFAFVVANPAYTHVSGLGRLNVIGWMTLVGLVLTTYFPLKARSRAFWGTYVVILGIVVWLITLSS